MGLARKSRARKNSSDYFLAGRNLPCWAIGASLIAANISAEQIIGMSGSAFVLGIEFVLCMAVRISVSAIQGAEPHLDAIDYKDVDTSTTTGFNVAAWVIVLMLAALYATWW